MHAGHVLRCSITRLLPLWNLMEKWQKSIYDLLLRMKSIDLQFVAEFLHVHTEGNATNNWQNNMLIHGYQWSESISENEFTNFRDYSKNSFPHQ